MLRPVALPLRVVWIWEMKNKSTIQVPWARTLVLKNAHVAQRRPQVADHFPFDMKGEIF